MTNKTTSKTHFTYDFFKKTISGTKASFNKANKGVGAEYEELTRMMAAQPTFTLVIKEQKKKATKAKRTYDGLDYKFMEDYIATFEDDILSNTYESVKKLAKDQGLAVYPMTKKWFLARFSSEEEGFDMNAGREKITSYLITQAEKQATNLNEEQTEHKEVKQNTNAPSPISTLVDKQILAAG